MSSFRKIIHKSLNLLPFPCSTLPICFSAAFTFWEKKIFRWQVRRNHLLTSCCAIKFPIKTDFTDSASDTLSVISYQRLRSASTRNTWPPSHTALQRRSRSICREFNRKRPAEEHHSSTNGFQLFPFADNKRDFFSFLKTSQSKTEENMMEANPKEIKNHRCLLCEVRFIVTNDNRNYLIN